MSNARDKANIPSLNFSSTGIDDNATSTAITIDSAENVGIGIVNPSQKLHVEGAGSTYARIKSTNAGTGTGLYFQNATSNYLIGAGSVSGGSELVFYDATNSAERMRITSAGRLGIGTTAPDATLEVNSVNSDTNSIFKSTDNNCIIIISDDDSSSTIGVDNDGSGGALKFNTGGDGSYANNSEAMRIDSSGAVSIATTSAANGEKLKVQGKIYINAAESDSIFTTGACLIFPGTYNNIRQSTDHSLVFDAWNNSNVISPLTIKQDGKIGIGTSSPTATLHVDTSNSAVAPNAEADDFFVESSGNTGITIGCGISSRSSIYFANSTDNDIAKIVVAHDEGSMKFTNNTAERMRITSSGDVFIAKTGTAIGTVGIELDSTGSGAFTTSAVPVLYVNRLTDDGDLIRFFQASTEEGSISVSGGNVSYNGFTGTHWSRFTDNSTPNILRGTVLETLDEMCDWYNLEFDVTTQDAEGNDVTTPQKIPHILLDAQSNGDVITYNHEGIDVQATIVKENDVKHMMSKVSDTVDAKNVYGVFVAYDEDGEGYNDFYVASVGSFVVRIKANETIAKGDLLQSNGDGTAKVQTDDNVKSSSFAKVLSTTIIETYEDGSYLVPCSLMC